MRISLIVLGLLLFEIQSGLEDMHGTARRLPRRIAYRDFSLWPAGPLVKDTDESRAAFKQTQKQQLDHMWDQTQP
jgi:hydroxyacylglutathione hydrolase